MKKNGLFLLSLVFISMALVLAGCVSQSGNTGSNGSTNTGTYTADVVRLTGGDYGYPQPFTVYPRGPGVAKMTMIFDGLVEKDEKGIIPWLAEDWDISEDGTEYTFYLRDNVLWHDGVAFTADDVLFTYKYEQTFVPVYGGAMESGVVEDVQVIDDHTVEFVLTEPISTFIYKLYNFKIIPEHIYADVDDPATFIGDEAVIGTGPYKLAAYNQELGSYKFVANEDFWGPDPAIGTVEFIPVSEEVIAFEQGEIDTAMITPDTLDRFTSDTDVRIAAEPGFFGYELYFNMVKRPELGDKTIRQAFAYAIDREEMVEKIARGAGKPGALGALPQDHIWYNPDQPAYAYDTKMAAGLLEEAGWTDTDGDGIREKDGVLMSYTLSLASDEVRIGELVKERMRQVGIDIQVKALESRSRDANLESGDFELIINGYGGLGYDADYLRTKYCGEGYGIAGTAATRPVYGFQNGTFDALAASEILELDDAKRQHIVFDMQIILAEEVPTIPLLYYTSYDVWRISAFNGWMNMYDHHVITHSKLSFVERDGIAAER
jgi:peptide/nickel transport system substrate-binding protein